MPIPLTIRAGLWIWLLAAVFVGYSGLLQNLPLPAVQGLLVLLTALGLLACRKVPRLRAWLDGVDLRALVLLHVTRFVGIYFLILYHRGLLPMEFAVRGGWGDIVVATGALLLCVLPLDVQARRHGITIWNVVGAIDIGLVVATGAWLGLHGNAQMRALTVLPLSLLPTFLVPLIIITHVIIFLRLRREAMAVAP